MTRLAAITYPEACADPHLFGPWFEGESWAAWRVMDKALFGLPLDDDELAVFRDLTGRDEAPTEPVQEAWLGFGRRSGKDVKAASIVSYLGTIGAELYGYRRRLTRGERGVVQILAVDRDQARVCLDYTKAFFEQPMLARMVKRFTADGLDLTNGLAIEITTNDQRRVRGRTVIAAIFDEVAHWRSENSANPDEDVYQAVKPSMATIPNAMLIGISSTYARRGLMWSKYRKHWAQPGSILFAKAPTWVMNPTIARDSPTIVEAFERDPAWAAAEYGSEFRIDIEQLLTRESVEACIDVGTIERPPVPGVRYSAFCDPSGGSSDSMTLAIGHVEGKVATIDAVRERRPPFSPEAVVSEFADLLKAYGLSEVTGDRYGGLWPRERFTERHVTYKVADKTTSDNYLALVSAMNSRRVALVDNPRLTTQLLGLERKTSRGGRDLVSHAVGAHDDIATSCAGLVYKLLMRREFTDAVPCAPKIFVNGHEITAPEPDNRPARAKPDDMGCSWWNDPGPEPNAMRHLWR